MSLRSADRDRLALRGVIAPRRGAFETMEALCAARPVGLLTLRDDELEQRRPLRKIQSFARQVALRVAPPLFRAATA